MYGKTLIQTKKGLGQVSSRNFSTHVRSDAAPLETLFTRQKVSIHYWKKNKKDKRI